MVPGIAPFVPDVLAASPDQGQSTAADPHIGQVVRGNAHRRCSRVEGCAIVIDLDHERIGNLVEAQGDLADASRTMSRS